MTILGLIFLIFVIAVLIGVIVWAWPQLSIPGVIKNAILIALIVVCVVLLIYILAGGGIGLGHITL